MHCCFSVVLTAFALAVQATSAISQDLKAKADLPSSNPPITTFRSSPITPGFWAWPRKLPSDATEVAAACRSSLSLQLADGQFLTLSSDSSEALDRAPLRLLDHGQCRFDSASQTDRCELSVPKAGGSPSTGSIEVSYSIEPGNTLKMSVRATIVTGAEAPKTEAHEIYPVRCPDQNVYDILTSATQPR
jgi:hypothetical protein